MANKKILKRNPIKKHPKFIRLTQFRSSIFANSFTIFCYLKLLPFPLRNKFNHILELILNFWLRPTLDIIKVVLVSVKLTETWCFPKRSSIKL
ncbi:hypothetical protein BpHYR1_010901 [Brachionus plicatilis]|uniref:Uncharacterized protein n=1 Tax=Brachionus plicatilis TaxID=10195 RepID=A0A3M7QVY6_BRAPC|nr:hypothetical protein BpHYR1_010901 [Brachionus plicatilis]